MRSKNCLFLFVLFVAASCSAQNNVTVAKPDSVFQARLNLILADMPKNFTDLKGEDFFEYNGSYSPRTKATLSMPNAAISYITEKFDMVSQQQYTYHSLWNYRLKDSTVVRQKADSIGQLITGTEFKYCERLETKDYSTKANYFRYFFTTGKKEGMPDMYNNVYMQITIEKDFIKKGVKGYVIHLEIREEELPQGSD